MLERGSSVVIAGVSARALAQSAVRAGYRVTAVDAFGDRDLRAIADVVALRRDERKPYSARGAANIASGVAADAAAYVANFENYPEAITRLAAGRTLLGNRPEVVAQVRKPVALMRVLRQLGFAVPETRGTVPSQVAGRWLVKPRRSGGGHGTRVWRRGRALGRGRYLQQQIDGIPGSITFAADGRRAVPLGLSRQLTGDAAFGVSGFRYCGSMLGSPRAPLFDEEHRLREIATALADAVTAAFGLVGVNGLDFIARDGIPYPIEVNPRYSASMELVERACQVSVFDIHVRACAGVLPPRAVWDACSHGVHGKAIVFARHSTRLEHTAAWLDDAHADVPHPGERIGRGHPICTVFARGRTTRDCYDKLARRAAEVYRTVAPARRGAA